MSTDEKPDAPAAETKEDAAPEAATPQEAAASTDEKPDAPAVVVDRIARPDGSVQELRREEAERLARLKML